MKKKFDDRDWNATYVTGFLTACGNLTCIVNESRRAGLWRWAGESFPVGEQEQINAFCQYFFGDASAFGEVTELKIDDCDRVVSQAISNWISVVRGRVENSTTRVVEDDNFLNKLTEECSKRVINAALPIRMVEIEARGLDDSRYRNDTLIGLLDSSGQLWILFFETTV